MRRLFLVAALLFGLVPLSAAPAALAEATQTSHREKALMLAKTVQAPEIAVDGAMATLDAQIVDALLTNPDIKKLEAEHPGAVRAMWDGAKPVLRTQLEASLPELWQRLADVYAAHLADDQLEAATRFFRSPSGSKLLRSVNSHLDVRPMVADAVSQKGRIGQQAYQTSAASAAVGAVSTMSEDEQAEIIRFGASDAGRALAAIAPEVTQTGVEWMNKRDARADRLDAAMKNALQRFLSQHP